MKKCCLFLILALLLTGCGTAETFERVQDEGEVPVMAQMRAVNLECPESAVIQVMESEQQKLYLCGEYTLTVQTFASGDLNRTIRDLCGYEAQVVRPVETRTGELRRIDWVWTAMGEGGDQVGRALVLDDGNYHYCLTAMADADIAGSLAGEWNGVFSSFSLA